MPDRDHILASTPFGPVAVTVAGDGPPVLLLHGFPEHRGIWSPVMTALAGSVRLIAPDLPGFGDTPPLPAGMRGDRIGAVMAAMMQSLGHARFAVVCHDAGTVAGWWLAAARPEAVTHLALVSAVPPAAYLAAIPSLDACGARHHVARLLSGEAEFLRGDNLSGWMADPAARAAFVAGLHRSAPDAMRALYRENLLPGSAPFWQALPAPVGPILQILGDQDPFLPISLFPTLSCERHILPAKGHFLPATAHEAVAAILRPWLTGTALPPDFVEGSDHGRA
jgi:pimeloyl-ACP methyl ester carboxylesterase